MLTKSPVKIMYFTGYGLAGVLGLHVLSSLWMIYTAFSLTKIVFLAATIGGAVFYYQQAELLRKKSETAALIFIAATILILWVSLLLATFKAWGDRWPAAIIVIALIAGWVYLCRAAMVALKSRG